MTTTTKNQTGADAEGERYQPILAGLELDIRQFTVICGDYGVSWDVAGKRILGEVDRRDGPIEDDDELCETMFQLVGVCPHCEAIHMPIFVWHGFYGLFVADAGGMDVGGMPVYRGPPLAGS